MVAVAWCEPVGATGADGLSPWRLKDDSRLFIRSGSRITFEDPLEFGGAPVGVMRAHMLRRCK